MQAVVGSTVPDLRDRFIVGSGSSYSLNSIGGYTDTFIPEHTHTYSGSVSGGNHNHTYVDQYVVINNGYRPWPANNNDCAARNVNVGGNGSHSHSISGTTGNPSNTGTNSQGSSATNANLPPYYALVYIIKY